MWSMVLVPGCLVGGGDGLCIHIELHNFVRDCRDCMKRWSIWQLKSPAKTTNPSESWILVIIGVMSANKAASGVMSPFCCSKIRFCCINAEDSLFFVSVALYIEKTFRDLVVDVWLFISMDMWDHLPIIESLREGNIRWPSDEI